MLTMASETYTSVASPIQYAARRAFVIDCIELNAYKERCRRTLQLVCRWCCYQLEKISVTLQVPQGGFYLFPSFATHRKALKNRSIFTDRDFCERLLQSTGVAVLPGSCFGRDPAELYVRIAFVDFKGDLALYLIDSMPKVLKWDDIDGFIQSVCPNLDVAIRKLSKWVLYSPDNLGESVNR
uniref:Aspartate aminotransferase putative n=1 Tax=Albugo laibachii Nc14 TaxID=890382 RepID=F0W015_9STRA|nr:aspartate aminotransferase putative [Albugo laibachii Nc14]|eukprot:CCA14386.1 aspartate aminotransferase putative [Albugo laibachii Nc14]